VRQSSGFQSLFHKNTMETYREERVRPPAPATEGVTNPHPAHAGPGDVASQVQSPVRDVCVGPYTSSDWKSELPDAFGAGQAKERPG
jgi:hypothetical protein